MRHALEDGFGSPFSGGSGSAYSSQPRSHVRQKKLFVPDLFERQYRVRKPANRTRLDCVWWRHLSNVAAWTKRPQSRIEHFD